jgi:hypothetical protein
MESDFKVEIFTKKFLALDSFGPGVVFCVWVIVLLRETLSNLFPAVMDVEFLFEIPSFCSAYLLSLGFCFVFNSLVKTSLFQK